MNKEEDRLEVGEGPPVTDRSKRRKLYLLLGLLLLVIGYALWSFHAFPDVYQDYRDLIQLFADRTRLRTLVLSYGDFAPLVFIALQILQVVIAIIPGEATGILGGFLFGAFPGFLYSSIGLSLGSLLAFGLARWLGMRFVRRMVRPELYQKFAFLREPRGIVAVFLLFLIPGFPKDYLSYILGVSPIPLWAFFLVTSLGRIPGTWLLSIQGAKFHAEESHSLALFFVIGAFLVLLAYIYRARIMEFVRGHKADAP